MPSSLTPDAKCRCLLAALVCKKMLHLQWSALQVVFPGDDRPSGCNKPVAECHLPLLGRSVGEHTARCGSELVSPMPWGCCQSMLWLLTHRGHLMAQTTGGRLLTGICTSSSYINLAMCSSLLHSHLHLKMCRVLPTRKDRWERHPWRTAPHFPAAGPCII